MMRSYTVRLEFEREAASPEAAACSVLATLQDPQFYAYGPVFTVTDDGGTETEVDTETLDGGFCDEAGDTPLAACMFCHRPLTARDYDAHDYGGGWVCSSCWDERLRASE